MCQRFNFTYVKKQYTYLFKNFCNENSIASQVAAFSPEQHRFFLNALHWWIDGILQDISFCTTALFWSIKQAAFMSEQYFVES